MTLRRWTVAAASLLMVGWLGSTAGAIVEAPRAVVAASFQLRPAMNGTGFACSSRRGSASGTRYVARGTETDLSGSPHPELTGDLTVRVREVFPLPAPQRYPARVRLTMTLRSQSGVIKYAGTADLAGEVTPNGHIVASGLLLATIYHQGRPAGRRLVANISFASDSTDGAHPMTGTLGSGTPRSIAIETRAAC